MGAGSPFLKRSITMNRAIRLPRRVVSRRRGPHGFEIDRTAQEKAWRAAGIGGGRMKQKRMDQNHVSCFADVLDNLKFDAVVILGALDEALYAFFGGGLVVQVSDVRVAHERFAVITAAIAGPRRVVLEPVVKEFVRAGEKNGRPALRRDIAHEC